MKRLVTTLTLLYLFVCATAARVRAEDEVYFYDTKLKKVNKIVGTIQSENPSRIVIKPDRGVGTREIAIHDLRDVIYTVPQLIRQDYRKASNRERDAMSATREETRKTELQTALELYKDLADKVTEEKAKRNIEFKIAKLLTLTASNAKGVEKATEALRAFRTKHAKSWQISECTELLAQMQMEGKDWEGAQKTFEEMAAMPGLPAELRQDCDLKIAQVMVRGQKYAEAEKKLQQLIKTVSSDSPQAVKLEISLAECEAASGKADQAAQRVEAVLAKSADPEIKAIGYNTLGFCHEQAKRPRDALYDYLWVDVIYHQNRHEHAKALYHLVKLFKELREDKRAREFRDKLEKDKDLAGQEYQRLLVNER
jgi:tetratricopeptide (TPR) repeat protein